MILALGLHVEGLKGWDLIRVIGWSFDGSKVAYTRWVHGQNDSVGIATLEILDMATSEIQQFPSPQGVWLTDGSWSPVGNQLVVYSIDRDWGEPSLGTGATVSAHNGIFLVDGDAGAISELRGPSDKETYGQSGKPAYLIGAMPWSHDGRSIIYSDSGWICWLSIDTLEETCPTEIADAIREIGAIGGEYPTKLGANWRVDWLHAEDGISAL